MPGLLLFLSIYQNRQIANNEWKSIFDRHALCDVIITSDFKYMVNKGFGCLNLRSFDLLCILVSECKAR